jgi:hypothetical protein
MTTPTRPRPSWFAIHMACNPTADPDKEWARLNSRTRDECARDDIASAIMIEGLEELRREAGCHGQK